MAATTIEIEERAKPYPMRFKLKLVDLSLLLDMILLPRSSYKAKEESMHMIGMALREATGISKERDSFLFINMPCCTEKVASCATQQFIIIVLPNIGRRARNVLVSSTCVAEILLLSFALFKNLAIIVIIIISLHVITTLNIT